MLTLTSTEAERSVLHTLIEMVGSGAVSGTSAWTYFSSPRSSKILKADKSNAAAAFSFTMKEIAAMKSLKKTLVTHLLRSNRASCAYCSRAIGRYGFGWHIEHVHPKSRFPEKTFLKTNLTIGCVDCNRWKASHVDNKPGGITTIIDPSSSSFLYSDHLGYVSISIDDLAFIKYDRRSTLGSQTWEHLVFREIERATLIDSINPALADIHNRVNEVFRNLPSENVNDELVMLLGSLVSRIYKAP